MDAVKVGGELESWCTTCKTMKWHVVVAVVDGKPAKVECHGCGKQHAFRAQAPGAPKPASASRARAKKIEPAAPAPIEDLEAKLRAGERDAKTYSPKDSYAEGDFVRHPTFGVGLVIALHAPQKFEVAFRDGRKLLVHARSGAPAQPALERPRRVDDDDAPSPVTDAPPARR